MDENANGKLLHLAPRPHTCDTPKSLDSFFRPRYESGSVWQCHCGQMWIVNVYHWKKAGWWTRWRYRKAATTP